MIQEPRSGESEPFSCSGAPWLGSSESESVGGSREELAVLLQLQRHQLVFLKLFPLPENGDAGDSDAVRARCGGVCGRPPRGAGTAEPWGGFRRCEPAAVFIPKSAVPFCQMLRLRKFPLRQGGFVSIPEPVGLVSRRHGGCAPGFLRSWPASPALRPAGRAWGPQASW